MNRTIDDTQADTLTAAIKEILTFSKDGARLCPGRDVLDRVGDKWSLLVVLHLGPNNILIFNDLRHRITGISQRMLTVTLRSLECDGLVTRTAYATVPPRVDYQLTALGQSLLGAVIELGKWATVNAPAIAQARLAFTK
jgi:DNA-binding HxlR family transcriptional regulator